MRITASKADKIFRATKDVTRIKYFNGSNSGISGTQQVQIKSLKYGLEMEPLARKKYSEVTKNDVVQVGLIGKTYEQNIGLMCLSKNQRRYIMNCHIFGAFKFSHSTC